MAVLQRTGMLSLWIEDKDERRDRRKREYPIMSIKNSHMMLQVCMVWDFLML